MLLLANIEGLSALWIAAGVAAAGVPIAAHLLTRRGGPSLLFPGVRFIQAAVADAARASRWRDLLLLLLRCLAILLLALAFDRPVWRAGGSDLAPGVRVEWVVVLDASASMGRTERGRTLFEQARDETARLLDRTDPARDGAAIVVAGVRPRPLLPRVTSNLDALRAALAEEEVTLERGDLAAALRLAERLPGDEGSPPPRRRIVVVTDLQRTQWDDVAPPIGAGGPVDVRLVPVGESAARGNLAVTEPAIAPARPRAGATALVTAAIRNSGQGPRQPTVRVRAGGVERTLAPSVPAEGTAQLAVEIVFPEPGLASAEIALVDESFTPDDAAVATATIRAARRVAVVGPGGPGDSGPAYFAAAGLAPAGGDPVVERLPARGLTGAALAGQDVVVVAGAGLPGDAALEALAAFVRAGGGLVWLVDDQAALDALALLETLPSGAGLAPVIPAGPFVRLPAGGPTFVAQGAFDRPEMALLGGQLAGAWFEIPFQGVAPLAVRPHAHALLELESGPVAAAAELLTADVDDAIELPSPLPLVAWGWAGLGRVATLHADVDPAASALVKSPLWPVLLAELVRLVAPTAASEAIAHVGEPLLLPAPPGRRLDGPLVDDRDRPARLLGMGDGIEAEPAPAPGLVTIRTLDGTLVAQGAVTLDPRESELAPIPAAEAEALLGVGLDGSVAAAAPPGREEMIELWPALVAAVVGLLGLEAAISLWTRRRRRAPAAPGALA